MSAETTPFSNRVELLMLASGALLGAGAWMLGSSRMVWGVISGTLFSVLNWQAWKWVSARIVSGRAPVALGWLALKMVAVGGVCWVLLSVLGVHRIGFAVGLGTLLVGALVGLSSSESSRPASSEPAAGKD